MDHSATADQSVAYRVVHRDHGQSDRHVHRGGVRIPTGPCVGYSWNFGDGSDRIRARTRRIPTPPAGTYGVTLTVTDNQGATGTGGRSGRCQRADDTDRAAVCRPGVTGYRRQRLGHRVVDRARRRRFGPSPPTS